MARLSVQRLRWDTEWLGVLFLKGHPGSVGVSPALKRLEAEPVACGHNCGRDARAPRVAVPLQNMSNLEILALAGLAFTNEWG